MRSRNEGWIVTHRCVVGVSRVGAPRICATVTGCPSNARAAVAAKRHHELGRNQTQLFRQPPVARLDFARARFDVQPPLAAGLELEMLDRVGDIDRLAAQPRIFQRTIEHRAGGANERMPLQVLLVAGASPTSMSLDGAVPSPGTPCVADFHSEQRLHAFTASRSSLVDVSVRAPVSAFSSSLTVLADLLLGVF